MKEIAGAQLATCNLTFSQHCAVNWSCKMTGFVQFGRRKKRTPHFTRRKRRWPLWLLNPLKVANCKLRDAVNWVLCSNVQLACKWHQLADKTTSGRTKQVHFVSVKAERPLPAVTWQCNVGQGWWWGSCMTTTMMTQTWLHEAFVAFGLKNLFAHQAHKIIPDFSTLSKLRMCTPSRWLFLGNSLQKETTRFFPGRLFKTRKCAKFPHTALSTVLSVWMKISFSISLQVPQDTSNMASEHNWMMPDFTGSTNCIGLSPTSERSRQEVIPWQLMRGWGQSLSVVPWSCRENRRKLRNCNRVKWIADACVLSEALNARKRELNKQTKSRRIQTEIRWILNDEIVWLVPGRGRDPKSWCEVSLRQSCSSASCPSLCWDTLQEHAGWKLLSRRKFFDKIRRFQEKLSRYNTL